MYSLDEWKQIKECAVSVMMKTGTFIRRMPLDGQGAISRARKPAIDKFMLTHSENSVNTETITLKTVKLANNSL